MKNKRIKNPLIRRIPRKMRCEWRKYLVVGLFLILTIEFVSGMYVANGSMIKALEKSISRYMLEDGHFELSSKADENLISNIRTGVKADVKQYYLNQAKEELDKKYGMAFPVPAFLQSAAPAPAAAVRSVLHVALQPSSSPVCIAAYTADSMQ